MPDDIQVVGADLGLPPVGLDAKEVGRLMADELLRPLLDDLRVIQRANHLVFKSFYRGLTTNMNLGRNQQRNWTHESCISRDGDNK